MFTYIHTYLPTYILTFIMVVAWIILAIFVAQWTDFYSILRSSDKPNRFLIQVAVVGMGMALGQCLYLTIYLPKVKGLTDSSAWSVYSPRGFLPVMIALAVTSYFVFLRSIWPVWGFLAPLVFGTQLMGMVMSLHFVPAWNLF